MYIKNKITHPGKKLLYASLCERTRINDPSAIQDFIDTLAMDGFDFSDLESISKDTIFF